MVKPHIIDVLITMHQPHSVEAVESEPSDREGTGRKEHTIVGNKAQTTTTLPSDWWRRDFADSAIRCTILYSLQQRAALVEQSAAFLKAMVGLWRERGIDVEAVWREIDHRVQLGNLLNQINRDIPSSVDKSRKFWRPSSTKLP